MQIDTSAGCFGLRCFTDGWPIWVDLKKDGNFIARLRDDDLRDLIYAAQRMSDKIEAERK